MPIYLEEGQESFTLPTFREDPNASGVQGMFLSFLYSSFPSDQFPLLNKRQAILLWHICRGVPEVEWWRSDIDYESRRILQRDIRTLRDVLKVRSKHALPRAAWGLYSLAWGKPIVKDDNNGVVSGRWDLEPSPTLLGNWEIPRSQAPEGSATSTGT